MGKIKGQKHFDTPKKARVIGIIEEYEREGIPFSHNDVFKREGLSKATGWRVLRQKQYRTLHNAPDVPETRGAKRKLTGEHLDILESFIEDNGYDSRILQWQELLDEAGLDLDVSARTIRRRLRERKFRRCQACEKKYVSPRLAERRQEWAQTMLERYPEPEDWHHVRFSDETHFSWGPQGKVYVLRRPWERFCSSCIVEKREPPEKGYKRLHAWAAISYDFKSPLVWYDVPGNSNGKMSLQVYRDQILEPVVGQWLRDGYSFVLEEDNDSGHGTGKANIVRTWKRQNALTSYFNCAQSPDLAPIERAWAWPKKEVTTQSVWDDEALQTLAQEGWDKLKQSTINGWIDKIPEILKQLADDDELAGKMSGF